MCSQWTLICFRLVYSCLVASYNGRSAGKDMALLTNGAQSLGSYYCLIRRRFKRRRKKRSERKGNPHSSTQKLMLSWFLDFVIFSNWQQGSRAAHFTSLLHLSVKFEVVSSINKLMWNLYLFLWTKTEGVLQLQNYYSTWFWSYCI